MASYTLRAPSIQNISKQLQTTFDILYSVIINGKQFVRKQDNTSSHDTYGKQADLDEFELVHHLAYSPGIR